MDTLIKSPIEKFPIRFGFSNDLLSGETISTKTVTCVSAADGSNTKADIAYSAGPPVIPASTGIVLSESIVSPEVILVIQAGVENDEHLIQCVITTSLGNVYQRDLLLIIQTVVDDSFSKQPADAFLFDVDFTRRLETGDTVSTATCLATKESDGTDVSGSVAPTVEVITPKIGVHVAAGSDGETYLLGVRGTTVAGYVYEKNVRMNVQELP
jgi:hypothetical protein